MRACICIVRTLWRLLHFSATIRSDRLPSILADWAQSVDRSPAGRSFFPRPPPTLPHPPLAAMGFFDGAGEKVGIETWRIEDLKRQATAALHSLSRSLC